MNVVRFGGKRSNQNQKALSVVDKLALREGGGVPHTQIIRPLMR